VGRSHASSGGTFFVAHHFLNSPLSWRAQNSAAGQDVSQCDIDCFEMFHTAVDGFLVWGDVLGVMVMYSSDRPYSSLNSVTPLSWSNTIFNGILASGMPLSGFSSRMMQSQSFSDVSGWPLS
jgi:hypothetical protein